MSNKSLMLQRQLLGSWYTKEGETTAHQLLNVYGYYDQGDRKFLKADKLPPQTNSSTLYSLYILANLLQEPRLNSSNHI